MGKRFVVMSALLAATSASAVNEPAVPCFVRGFQIGALNLPGPVQVQAKDHKDGTELTITTKDAESLQRLKQWSADLVTRSRTQREAGCDPKETNWREILGEMRHGLIRMDPDSRPKETPAAIAKGKDLYDVYCNHCHGLSGKGDGPAAKELRRKPANLVQLATQFPDRQFFMQISYGRGEMPAWGDTFDEKEVWQLTYFIRSLGNKSLENAKPAAEDH